MQSIRKYLKYYWLESYLFGEVRRNFQKQHYLTPEEFFAIVIWKSNRSKTNVRRGIVASNQTVQKITEGIYTAKTRSEKVKWLTKIKFIGIPLASAILTVCYPHQFTVLDYRVWGVLQRAKKVSGRQPTTIEKYLEYADACKKYAKQSRVSLRDLDRIMWGQSFHKDLRKLVLQLARQ